MSHAYEIYYEVWSDGVPESSPLTAVVTICTVGAEYTREEERRARGKALTAYAQMLRRDYGIRNAAKTARIHARKTAAVHAGAHFEGTFLGPVRRI